MVLSNPKFSIIIPTYNGLSYLPTCIDTIISQNYNNYELIISDDHSTDGTAAYIDSLEHKNIKILHVPEIMSMAEHWEWALKHAQGEWLIFVGQDDGLQPYFFEICDKLTKQAHKYHLRTIMSERAYFFWPGCEKTYGDIAVNYNARKGIQIKSFKIQLFKTLCGIQNYFELPEMYTTSLFHKSIIEEAENKQNGKLFVTHPQDANLAAIACSLEKKYLFSNIPIGWVGSSPKSAGLAIVSESGEELKKLKIEYLEKTANSKLKYNNTIGNFTFASTVLYFWGAILETESLRNKIFNSFFNSSFMRKVVFSATLREMEHKGSGNYHKYQEFEQILFINKLNMNRIRRFSLLFLESFSFFYKIKQKTNNFLLKYARKIHKRFYITKSFDISVFRNWNDNQKLTLSEIQKEIALQVRQSNIL